MYGPQGGRDYCVSNALGDSCSELKRQYYPNIDPNDLWGFHGTDNPAAIEFMNRGKSSPRVTPGGQPIQQPDPQFGSELPLLEQPYFDQVQVAENTFDLGNADGLGDPIALGDPTAFGDVSLAGDSFALGGPNDFTESYFVADSGDLGIFS